MRARRTIPTLACLALLMSCRGEDGATRTAKTTAAPADKAAPSADETSRAAATPPASAAITAGASTRPDAALAPDAGAPPQAAVAVAKPLFAGENSDDVKAMFPRHKAPKEPLPEDVQRMIRYRMRDVSKAPIALRDAIYLPREDGGAEVLAVYEVSAYEECVQRHGGSRKKARDACLPELQTLRDRSAEDEEGAKVRLNRDCRNYGVVHASRAPFDQTVKGDRWKVSTLALPRASCKLSLQQLFLDDIDRDGRPELVLGGTTSNEEIEERNSETVVSREARLLWVFDVGEELTEQLQLLVAERWGAGETFWADLNGDRRADLVQLEDCLVGIGDSESQCDRVLLDRVWHLYDSQGDRWEVFSEDEPDK
jgi:hypothetical protein